MASMEDIERKIAALEAKVDKYREILKSATSDKRKDILLSIILSTRTEINDLYKEQEWLEQLGS